MSWPRNPAVKVLMIISLLMLAGPWGAAASQPETGDRLTVSGVMADAQGKGIKEVEIELLVNGRQIKPLGKGDRLETGSQSGVAPGEYRVTVSKERVSGVGANQIVLPGGIKVEHFLPQQYGNPATSPLRVTVGQGSQNHDFELTSGPTPDGQTGRKSL